MEPQIIAALIGLVVGAAGAWVKAVLAIREKTSEELRARRLEIYPAIYLMTAPLSFWPPAELSRSELLELNLRFRKWYFSQGGLYLSRNGRIRYGEMKEIIATYGIADSVELVPEDEYDKIVESASAFRAALTEDLDTRQQRSVFLVAARWRRHRKQHKLWDVNVGTARTTMKEKIGRESGQVPVPIKSMYI